MIAPRIGKYQCGQYRIQREEGTIMRSAKIILCILSIFSVYSQVFAQTPAHNKHLMPFRNKRIVPTQKRIVIAASMLLDGKGHVLKNTRVVIEGSKILRIDPKAGPIDYDLRGD